MNSINVLFLAAGLRDNKTNNTIYPQFLTEFDGETVLDLLVKEAKTLDNVSLTFAFSSSDIKKFSCDKIAEILAPNCSVVEVPDNTKGSACTALLAGCNLPQNEELLIICANELVDINLESVITFFRSEKFAAGTVVFPSVHPRYSSVLLDSENTVLQVSQKKPISRNATTGIFWFKKTAFFIESAKEMIRKGNCLDGNYFVALSMNELILQQKRVGVYKIDKDRYHPLKDEKQLSNFEMTGLS